MAILRVGTGGTEQNFNAVTTSQSYTMPAYTTGNWLALLFCVHGTGTTNSVPTVVGNTGGAWTVKNNVAGASGNWFNATIAYLESAVAGITALTIGNLDATGNFITAKSEQFSGVATSGSFDTTQSANAASPATTLASGNITLADPNGLVLGVCIADDSSNTAWTSTLNGFTELLNEGNSNSFQALDTVFRIASASVGPYSLTWNYSVGSDKMVSLLASFKPPQAAATNKTLQESEWLPLETQTNVLFVSSW